MDQMSIHPTYPRSQRVIGVYALPDAPGVFCDGWAVRSKARIDLWVVSEIGRLPAGIWQGAMLVGNRRPAFVGLNPVERVGIKRDGSDYYDPVHYGLALALKGVATMGMGIGYNRSDEARRSVVELLIESGRLLFEGQAETHQSLVAAMRDGSPEAQLVMHAVAAMTSSAVTAAYGPVSDEWRLASLGDTMPDHERHSSTRSG